MTASRFDRVLGSLCLAGMGDALGAQTEQWTIDEIAEQHGGLVTAFGNPPPDTFAGANNGKRAEVTDDASQMYDLAKALADAGGRLDRSGWIKCLLDWAATSPKAGFMGPSTASIVKALQDGDDVQRVGTIGTSLRKMSTVGNTNGAAMRVAPCGLIHPGDLVAACEQTFITCLPSHDTDVAVSSACCIAAAAAQALVTPDLESVIAAALRGAVIGEQIAMARVRKVPGPRFVTRLEMALEIARAARDDRRFLRELEHSVGNSVLAAESVPAAIGILAYAKADPLRTIALAASIGNDTDSIATMAGAISGAMVGAARLPAELYREFRLVNDAEYQLDDLADRLARIATRNELAGGAPRLT
jgi:ADP-ribosylglycohydrolase